MENYFIEENQLLGRKELKNGEFGKIFRAWYKPSGVTVTWKELHQNDYDDVKEDVLNKELSLQSRFIGNPNIVQILGVLAPNDQRKPTYGILMEYMDGGDLYDVIHSEISYCEVKIVCWAKQVTSALEFIHSIADIKTIHRDIKPENILLNEDGTIAKLYDFGLKRELTAYGKSKTGSSIYMAPEIFEGKNYDETSDIYSWGMTIWECYNRRVPFSQCKNKIELLLLKTNRAFELENVEEEDVGPSKMVKMCPDIEKLLQDCTLFDRTKRPSMKKIKQKLESIQIPQSSPEPTEPWRKRPPMYSISTISA